MREYITKVYYKNSVVYYILLGPKIVYDFFRHNLISDTYFLKKRYEKLLGRKLNLNSPQLFTEKLQWLKLNNRSTLLTKCADKLAVRDYVREKIGEEYLIPLIYYSYNPQDICLEKLPDFPVIIKTNHDSGGVEIINDKNNFDFKKIQKRLRRQLKRNFFYSSREWEYKNIKPCIIVEKLLQDDSLNDVLNDYKLYCFHGKPMYIQTIFDRKTQVKETWYNTNWELLDVYYFSECKKEVPKPKLLNELLKIATILAEDFSYVRVDLYISNNKIYFGELTFHPYGGFMKFNPPEFDNILGEQLKLS